LRPDFQILIYPVISFQDSIGHLGSRDQLIGKAPSAETVKEYSNELQVTENTPPCFLVHAQDDDVVKVKNSIVYYEALQKNKVPVEMHLFPKGGHGFGSHQLGLAIDSWFQRVTEWLKSQDLLKKR
jgi:dipeptidyl aminopeptidase/acylaminoacyl peptidase